MARVGHVFSRVLDFAGGGIKKMNDLLEIVKGDGTDQGGVNRDEEQGGNDNSLNWEVEERNISTMDLQTALRTIPSENTFDPQSPPAPTPTGKAAQILGYRQHQLLPAWMEVERAQKGKQEFVEDDSLASDPAEGPHGLRGAGRRRFCSEPTQEDVLHTLYPATPCRWGRDLGTTRLDSPQDLSDYISVKSSIAPPTVHRPISSPPASPESTAQAIEPFMWAYNGHNHNGWPRERPYPYMMERDVERKGAPAGRDALAYNSRYPSLSRKPLVN